ncbi:MAG: hypothetical protein JO071_16750 [Deltaproteobacteria bacterium]|nr:hypothetical protein [Deltaproteobacteria bacterium]
MKYQPGRKRVAHGTALIGWPLALVREVIAIMHEVYAELKRLNRSGDYRMARTSDSRRKQTQAFKAALAQRYREHNRCC